MQVSTVLGGGVLAAWKAACAEIQGDKQEQVERVKHHSFSEKEHHKIFPRAWSADLTNYT